MCINNIKLTLKDRNVSLVINHSFQKYKTVLSQLPVSNHRHATEYLLFSAAVSFWSPRQPLATPHLLAPSSEHRARGPQDLVVCPHLHMPPLYTSRP